ncbi:MAG: hypothetical protein JW981_07655 [Anaerolineae bacterium]|nr:hypothetical protein [Anaerolineae bacterium]
MVNLPIKHMTLYKHGVGFFERQEKMVGEKVVLSFRVEEMNDILKSLTVIDAGGGKVLGIDYATPKDRESQLEGCSIRLDNRRSLQDLLVSLQGRQVRLLLINTENLEGTLVGLDEAAGELSLQNSLVSLLLNDSPAVEVVTLADVEGVEILDGQAAADLRYFLDLSLNQEDYRRVTIRLTPGEHELMVSYIAPAPTWRVSYRLVVSTPDEAKQAKALLLGWGIFDNQLDEDLKDISLALVAGMPISFVYDLYTPFTPERPVVEEEQRVAAAPVEFEAQKLQASSGAVARGGAMMGMGMDFASPPPVPQRKALDAENIAQAVAVETTGKELGELFQYAIQTPVTVGRGQSAMVPIVSKTLTVQKELLYNAKKMPSHPVATLRMKNETGMTLERGPVTVIDVGEYVGEAVLPFTATGGEIVVPYAVELGVKVKESTGSRREVHSLRLRQAYLHFEEWHIIWHEYQLDNSTGKPLTVLLEHPRSADYELFDTLEPQEITANYMRFEQTVPAYGEVLFKVEARRMTSRREELHKQSHSSLQRYLKTGLMDRRQHDLIIKLLMLYDAIGNYEKQLVQLEAERQKIYQAQKQIQGNMGELKSTGKEGVLRNRYVDQLETTEESLRRLEQQEAYLKKSIDEVKLDIETRLKEIS